MSHIFPPPPPQQQQQEQSFGNLPQINSCQFKTICTVFKTSFCTLILLSLLPYPLPSFLSSSIHFFFSIPSIFLCLCHLHLFMFSSTVPFSHSSVAVLPFLSLQFFFFSSFDPPLVLSLFLTLLPPFTLTCSFFVFIPNPVSDNSGFQICVFIKYQLL